MLTFEQFQIRCNQRVADCRSLKNFFTGFLGSWINLLMPLTVWSNKFIAVVGLKGNPPLALFLLAGAAGGSSQLTFEVGREVKD